MPRLHYRNRREYLKPFAAAGPLAGMRRITLLLVTVALLPACGSDHDDDVAGGTATPPPPPPAFRKSRGCNGPVNRLVATTDGSGDVYVVGALTTFNATSAPGVVRLNADG